MDIRPLPCRAYIVYRDALFAQGMRSLLEWEQAAEIVGMETDVAKALEAMRTVRPDVLIVQESSKRGQSSDLLTFLRQGVAPRIVALSLEHDYATVYESNCVSARSRAEFVQAVRGEFTQQQLCS